MYLMHHHVFLALFGLLVVIGVACNEDNPTSIPPSATTTSPANDSSEIPIPATNAILVPTNTPVPKPPSASFSADQHSGEAPLMVTFQDESTGPITSWSWDFGDGATSSEQAPNHRFTIAGTYSVELKVSAPGGSDSSSMTDLITVQPGPPVSLEVSPVQAQLAIQEAVQLTAMARDEFGNFVPVTPEWSVVAAGGSIDASGLFTAGTQAGTFLATAKASVQSDSGELQATGTVTVEPGPISELMVEPAIGTLDIGSSQAFSFIVRDEFGNQIYDALSSWTTPANVGEIDANGLFTAGTRAGTFPDVIQIEVVRGGSRASAAADVHIIVGALDRIEVRPPEAIVQKGEMRQFEAVGQDQYGNEIPDLAFL